MTKGNCTQPDRLIPTHIEQSQFGKPFNGHFHLSRFEFFSHPVYAFLTLLCIWNMWNMEYMDCMENMKYEFRSKCFQPIAQSKTPNVWFSHQKPKCALKCKGNFWCTTSIQCDSIPTKCLLCRSHQIRAEWHQICYTNQTLGGKSSLGWHQFTNSLPDRIDSNWLPPICSWHYSHNLKMQNEKHFQRHNGPMALSP